MTESALARPARVAGRIALWAVVACAVLTLIAIGWVGARGAIAADHLRSAQSSASDVVAQIDDPAAVAAAIASVADDANAAQALTSDPVWELVEGTPWLGPQLRAVSAVAASVDLVAREALTPLAEVASSLSPTAFQPIDGRINLDAFVAVQDVSAEAASSMRGASDAVTDANSAAVIGPLREVVDEVEALLDTTGRATDALARASVLLPEMLGQDGPRDYLVIFQNNAEWRSLGGIAGALAQIRTNDGAMRLGTQDYAASFGRFDPAVMELEADVAAIYGEYPVRFMHNVTQVPDFAVSGQIARTMWVDKHGTELDGVISLDPVALSYILEATGPIELPSGDQLTSENAVSLLLNEVYKRYPDPTEQNAFFSETTSAVFGALAGGRFDASALLGALARAGEENRVLLWSAHEDDQAVLADTTLVGGLPKTDARATSFGVYLNDGTGSKMDFYQEVTTVAEWETCAPPVEGTTSGTATLALTIANRAPDSGLPEYITGGGIYGVEPGSAKTVGYVYLPTGFDLLDAAISTEDGLGGGSHDGHRVVSFDVTLAPGDSVTVSVSAQSEGPTGAQLKVRQTPTVNADVTPTVGTCL
ncbi:DUF4012 domain-containing protein [Microbacterium sp. Marseille-Q6648]|uniref:DUF4012 domain-containing protein n=1 Tax=Microbacterium sp. Marseille-Q6648 TaxID=2937991 RepID=UPI00203E152C|nr:DUF4012 domain-containing protein [Microbacterium sp. Marseille-Q6648]